MPRCPWFEVSDRHVRVHHVGQRGIAALRKADPLLRSRYVDRCIAQDRDGGYPADVAARGGDRHVRVMKSVMPNDLEAQQAEYRPMPPLLHPLGVDRSDIPHLLASHGQLLTCIVDRLVHGTCLAFCGGRLSFRSLRLPQGSFSLLPGGCGVYRCLLGRGLRSPCPLECDDRRDNRDDDTNPGEEVHSSRSCQSAAAAGARLGNPRTSHVDGDAYADMRGPGSVQVVTHSGRTKAMLTCGNAASERAPSTRRSLPWSSSRTALGRGLLRGVARAPAGGPACGAADGGRRAVA